jgi:GT2 family glycosyltransferase
MNTILVENVPIVVLNWNGWDDSIKCITSIYAAENKALIWLVDNNSNEDRSSELQVLFPELRLVLFDKNHGWAVGNNKAIKVAADEGFEFIYLINNDCLVEKDFLSSSLLVIDDSTASIGSHILSYDNQHVIFDGSYASPNIKPTNSKEVKTTGRVNGAGMLVSIKNFYEVGEFDARYFCYSEETEWCERACQIGGFTIKVNLGSIVRHRNEGSNISENALYYQTRNCFIKTSVRSPYIPDLVDLFFDKVNGYIEQGNEPKVNATLCGLQDGLAGKFGFRTSHKVNLLLKWQCYLYSITVMRFCIRTVNKIRAKLV